MLNNSLVITGLLSERCLRNDPVLLPGYSRSVLSVVDVPVSARGRFATGRHSFGATFFNERLGKADWVLEDRPYLYRFWNGWQFGQCHFRAV